MGKRAKQRERERAFRRAPPGAPPGTMHVGPDSGQRATLRLICYGPDTIHEHEGHVEDLPAMLAAAEGSVVRWIDVVGVEDLRALEAIGDAHQIHALALEDVAHVHQRAKVEHYASHAFITTRMFRRDANTAELDSEQISLFLGEGWLLTFQERDGDVFDAVRDRLRQARGRIRTLGADYLAYALLDAIVDSAFPILEAYDAWLDRIEERVVAGHSQGVVGELHAVRRDLLQLRRGFWPLREAMSALLREETPFIALETHVFLRDCHDHSIQVLDLVDSWREIGSSLMDLHLSAVGQRTNETMRLLTVISVLFMPMSFVAGLYGMNFERSASAWNMPELGWAYGYPMALLLMVGSALGFLYFFKRRGFLQAADETFGGGR
ncbi:MAG: Magnesium transport protein CorA [Pseudomonadota bacterium]